MREHSRQPMDSVQTMELLHAGRGPDVPAFLSAMAAATALGVSHRTVRRAIARGELPARKIGGTFRITPQALAHYRRHLHGPGFAVRPSDEPPPLPVPLTSFVGRTQELLEIQQMLVTEGVRLLTLTGPGGVGKTRLALHVASVARSDEQNDVQFVSLAEVDTVELVFPAIAQALGIQAVGSVTPEVLVQHLRGRDMLLILDNLEHVVAAAPSIAQVLAQCPHLRVLATSRVRLRIQGEHEYPIQPLSYPVPRARRSTAPELAADLPPALALFAARAREVTPRFKIDAHNVHVVTDICAHLDGLPLAIELAAARMRVLSPKALLAELSRRLAVLTGGSVDRPTRHQTMRNTIAWSYTLLPPADQAVFRRLAVCQGGFSLDLASAIAVAGPGPVGEPPLEVVQRLVEHSLIQPLHDDEDRPRFAMLETIREFGLERLTDRGEEAAARRAHAAWALAFARQHEVAPYQLANETKLQHLATEHSNLDTALEWTEDQEPEIFVRLVAAIGWLWWIRRYRHQEVEWLERASGLHECVSFSEHARIMTVLGFVQLVGGNLSRAQACFIEGVPVYRSLGHEQGVAHMLLGLGVVATYQQQYGQASARFEEALRHAQAIPDPHRSMALIAAVLRNRSVAARDQGQLREAESDQLRAYEMEQEVGSMLGMLHSLADLGDIARDLGDPSKACSYYLQSLRLGRPLGETRVTASVVEGIATVIAAEDAASAARLLAAADRWRRVSGVPRQVQADDRACETARATALATLGKPAFTMAWSSGEGMVLEEAIEVAEWHAMLHEVLSGRSVVATADADAAPADPLPVITAREFEVLRLLAAGLSDRAIADRLFLGVRTVESHVRKINRKLGTTSRAAALAEATVVGLLPEEAMAPPVTTLERHRS